MRRLLKKIAATCLTLTLALSSFGISRAATSDQNLLNTYGDKFERVGTCVTLRQLQNQGTLNIIKQRYNSITLENEMKPDALLGRSPNLISVSQAKSMGYYIPDGYKESNVPRINFSTVDKVLEICDNNGLGVRAHTLVWHAQTPNWLFRSGYQNNSGYVSRSVMNARMEYYIKNVMNHVYTNEHGKVVYAWDVVNEYLHSNNESGWLKIYGNVSTSPQFVKDAFRYAHETLSYFNLTDRVSLFYNDYNEYMEVSRILKLVQFINSGTKYCNGVGGQSHLSTDFPSASYYKDAYTAFKNAGLEMQITELDAGANSESSQASYLYDVMKGICEVKKAGGNITGITWWGLSDDVSWRKEKSPLLFSNINTPKASYYRTIDAFNNVFGTQTGTTLSNGWYYIKNINAQKYLTVAGNNGANGTNVEIRTGNGSDGQKWNLKNLDNGNITLTSKLGNYSLDVANGENADKANVQIYESYGGTAQQFKLAPGKSNGQFGILTNASNGSKSLDVYNLGKEDGTNVCQYTYRTQDNQLWIFEPIR